MLWLYRLLFVPVLLISSPYYLLRMKKRGGYRRHFRQRLGAIGRMSAKHPDVRRIWIQAVSVGEMFAIAPILESFRQDRRTEFYLTTTTSTGYKLARERYQESTIGIGYFPIDWWPFSARAWYRIDPDLVILTEGERWPEHVFQARRRGVPVISLNARISDRSFQRMQTWKTVSKLLLRGITRVLACSETDAQRFRDLGVDPALITTTGNIKLDLSVPPLTAAETESLRQELGFGADPVLLGASTWPGEEEALIATLSALRQLGIHCRLLLVPRHAERRKEVLQVVRESGLMYHFRSRGPAPREVDILIADTTGELRRLTHLGDLVFVGKSLPPHQQGQTPVEAVALSKPVLFGPGMSNFRSMADDLVHVGAARRVNTAEELKSAVIEIMRDDAKRQAMSVAAAAWHLANQGAVQRTLVILREELSRLETPPSGGDAAALTTKTV